MSYRRRPLWRILLDEFRRIEEEMSRIEDEFIRRIKEVEGMSGSITPLHNLYESGDEIIFTADMPGSSKEEIDLRVGENYIRVEAPCRSPIRGERKYLLHVELPVKIDPTSVRARYKDGVLEVVARKRLRGFRIRVE